MSILKKLKPNFWDHEDVAAGPYKHLFNFRRIWKLAVLLSVVVTIIPLLSLTMIDQVVSKKSIESEIILRVSRLVSNTSMTVSFFMRDRWSVLEFVTGHNTFAELRNPERLSSILDNLKSGFGGFEDLGLIESSGIQTSYAGPFMLDNLNYNNQPWYRNVLEHGAQMSEVTLGYRGSPHLDIAVKKKLSNNSFYVLRASINSKNFNDLFSQFHASGLGDAFLINNDGVLQTSSAMYGKVLDKIPLPVPQFSESVEVMEVKSANGEVLIVGYSYIPQTPFILMILNKKDELLVSWQKTRSDISLFLVISILVILIVILGGTTYLVEKIHLADQKRIMTLHQVEYQNKLASIGRLAAGAAHQINNPLAIINQKAGLIKDLFRLKDNYKHDQKLMDLVDSILSSVDRCGSITKSLLNFAGHLEVKFQLIDLGKIINNVLILLGRDAERKSIDLVVNIEEDISKIESDQSHLQQIFLNILNNTFEALKKGGRLEIQVEKQDNNSIKVVFTDDRPHIPEKDLKRIFDPFFSTKGKRVGTGLGLPITYGLVQEIGGSINVKSVPGQGTSFIIILPFKMEKTAILNEESMTLE